MYYIGKLSFKTKKIAEDYTRKILVNIGFSIVDETHAQFQFLSNLVKNHVEKESKIGCGIKNFIIQPNYQNSKAYELVIERTDNSKIDISWKKCASSSTHIHTSDIAIQQNLKSAMRQSINAFIQSFREKSNLKCIHCGSIDDVMHVDHDKPSFKNLFDTFLIKYPNHPKLFDEEKHTHQAIFKWKDNVYSKTWQTYHNCHARLQILCPTCNLTKAK